MIVSCKLFFQDHTTWSAKGKCAIVSPSYFIRTPWTTSNVHEHHQSACHFLSTTQKRSGCHLLQVRTNGAPQVTPRQSMCGCTHDFPLEISVSPSPLRLLGCQNLVVTLPLSCLQTVKVNTENSEEEEYVPQERQPSEANKNNGCASTRNRFHF